MCGSMETIYRERNELGPYMTFQPDKKKPIFNWLYYKEAFSSNLVHSLVKEFDITGPVLDPFVGVGTVPLACKYDGIVSVGRDASPLAVLAATVKTRNYDDDFLKMVESEAQKVLEYDKKRQPKFEWDFELFNPIMAFPPRNFTTIRTIRENLEYVDDARVKDFLMVALLSILPQVSYVLKDGGVLKIVGNKRVGDAKAMFRKKIKRMLRDVREYGIVYDEPDIQVGSAMNLELADGCINGIITSPPYLNNVDYTKIYGLELSLIDPHINVKQLRQGMVRSFLRKGSQHIEMRGDDRVYELLTERLGQNMPLIAYAYFSDMCRVIEECTRVLRKGGVCAMVVGNAVLERANIECDDILARLAQDYGMETEVWVGSFRHADVPVKGKLPVRESCIIMRK